MCGIAGYIVPTRPAPQRVAASLRMMRHRGPDHQAAADIRIGAQQVTLLHSRLSIIDLDARAHQPLSIDGRTLIFNGELYNYRELRRELETLGHRFVTQSDSEVLLRGYIQWQDGCFDRFEGMWALAIADPARGCVVLSRDRFGEKPLYLLERDGGLYFASEIKILHALAGEQQPINRRHLMRYLVNGYKSLFKRPETFFEGVRPLPPATNLLIDGAARSRAEVYWRPRFVPAEMSAEQAADGVRERLERSMELRLRADVPVAFCLSGGVDSGALASLASRRLGRPVATYSIIDRDARYDESANTAATVRDIGCRHTPIEIPRAGALERLARLVRDHDGPVCTISYYVHSMLSEAIAADGCRVAISGTGADELFTGYYDHFNLHLYALRDARQWPQLVQAWQRGAGRHVRNPYLSNPRLYLDNPGFREHIYLHREQFAELLHDDFDEPFEETAYCDDLLRSRMLNELLHETVPPILHADDLNSMRVSVENRSPYLDRALVEFALTIPSEHLIRDGLSKWPLRAAMRGILNDSVRLDDRKVGFNASFESILDPRDPQVRACLMDDSPVFELVDRGRLEPLLNISPPPNSLSKFLFNFVCAKLFVEAYARQEVYA